MTVSIETTISGNIPRLTLDTTRLHGNTCLASRINIGFFIFLQNLNTRYAVNAFVQIFFSLYRLVVLNI